jgi:hypothetical protein
LLKAAVSVSERYGYLELQYTTWNAQNLFAPVMLHLKAKPIAFHIDPKPEAEKSASGAFNGFWWNRQAGLQDVLILTNEGSRPNKTHLVLTDTAGKQVLRDFVLTPHSMLRLSVLELVRAAGFTSEFGSIHLEPEFSGSFQSLHFVYDPSSGFSALMKIFELVPNKDLRKHRAWSRDEGWTLWAPMLALSSPDPGLWLPSTVALKPYIFVENLAAKTTHTQIRLFWRSRSANGKTAPQNIDLQPNVARRLDVMATFKDLPQDANWATVSILTNSGPDEVVAVAASYDDTGRYGAQTPFSDQLAAHWEGALWSVDAAHNSMITVGNGGRKATRAQLTFRYQGPSGPETYVLEQELDKDEQMFVDLSDLARNQTPDVKGHTFSQTATSGSYTLLELGSPGLGNLFEGKVVTDKRFGDVAYGCMICCGMADVGLSPNPITLGVGSTTSYTGSARNGCTHTLQSINAYYSTWWSDNTAVATAAAGQGTAVGPGTTTVWASGILPFPAVTEDSPDACETQPLEDPATMNVDDFNLSPAQQIMDSQQGSFSATVTGGTASSYQWTFSAPTGAGNIPKVNFTAATSSQTGTDGRWFALPDVACPTQANIPGYYNAVYTLSVKVLFNDGVQTTKSTTLTVNALWDPAGVVDPNQARVTGVPSMSADGSGVWHVTGLNTLARQIPTSAMIKVISTSQFFNKTVQHEQVHLNNWIAGVGHLYGDLFNPNDFLSQIQNLTGTSQPDLLSKVNNAFQTYDASQVTLYNGRLPQDEAQAHAVSDPIAPLYIYQTCSGGPKL